jgi:hypothetical protein
MNAVKDHGAGATLANISFKLGLRGQYGPSAPGTFDIATLSGRDWDSSMDIAPSSSASQSPTEEQWDPVECAESTDTDDVFRAIITLSQKLPLRRPSGLGLRISR